MLAVSYGLLVMAWAVTNPITASPDEIDHFLRAQSVGRGQVLGDRNYQLDTIDPRRPPPKKCCQPNNEAAIIWVIKGTKAVDVPARLAIDGCRNLAPTVIDGCLTSAHPPKGEVKELTTMGTVEPAAYLVPGLATRLGGNPVTAMRLARIASAAVAILLLGAAILILAGGEHEPVVLVGVFVAVTPMVLFVSSLAAPSGAEIAGALCFFASLIRLSRVRRPRPAVWCALAVSGVVLASSRSLGPGWIALALAVIAAYVGPRVVWRRFREGRHWAIGAAGAILLAGVATAAWEAMAQPGIDFDGRFFLSQIRPSFSDFPRLGRELVGVFGSLDVNMPAVAYLLWAVMVVSLLVLAFLLGRRRERVVLIGLLILDVAVTVVVSAGTLRQNGFGLQGRHVLAFLLLTALLAGEIVARNASRLPDLRQRYVVCAAAGATGVQGLAWYTNSRHWANGKQGRTLFMLSSRWAPPGRWWPWLAVVAVAVTSCIAAALLESPRRRPRASTGRGAVTR